MIREIDMEKFAVEFGKKLEERSEKEGNGEPPSYHWGLQDAFNIFKEMIDPDILDKMG